MNIIIIGALIVIGVLLFCLMILVHEFGHFSMAKLFGVKVNEFAIGMGPKLFSKKKGDTLYSIRAVPIGGFCAMEGEDQDSNSPDAFGNKKVWQKIIIVAMGGILNIILGFIMMIIILSPQEYFGSNEIAVFMENAPSQQSGLQQGDFVTSFGGYSVNTDRDLIFALSTDDNVRHSIATGEDCYVNVCVNRNGENVEIPRVKFDTVQNDEGKRQIQLDFKVKAVKKDFFSLIGKSAEYTVSTIRMVWSSLVGLVMGKFTFNDMAGPVGTANLITKSAAMGLSEGFGTAVSNIVFVMIILTVNLGIFNLLPIPALDGGRLVFLIFEAIFRKPVPAKFERVVHAAGFALLITFMVFITFNDILRIVTGSGVG